MAIRLAPGTVFAHDYRVVQPLSQGGMGAVYIVEQTSTGARRALKLMLPHLASDDDARMRFEREAKVGARIASDHVVQVLAAGVDEKTGSPFLVMELLEGESLDARVRRDGPLSHIEARALFAQLAHAIGAAHNAGIVHRDLKPENLHVGRDRRADELLTLKVLDFGIAKLTLEAGSTSTAPIGTLAWMAPEQADEKGKITPATDVWSIGLIAFWSLIGATYWRAASMGGSAAGLVKELVLDKLPLASARAKEVGATGLPIAFDDWFSRCVVRDPSERFQDGGKACTELTRLLNAPTSESTVASPLSLASAPTEAAVALAPASQTIEPRRKGRRRIFGVLATAAALAVVVFLFRDRIAAMAGHWSRGSGPSLAAAHPTAITELEPPKCSNPKVLALYQAASQELRDANWSHARARFAEAAKLEPECAGVELRLAITGDGEHEQRESLQRALEHRSALNERDRLLLGVLEPVLRETPDFGLALERARAASARFPGDAELMVLVGNLDTKDPEEAVQFARRATELDPAYGDAWQGLARAERKLGHDTEALAALDRCIEASPTSADCRRDRGKLYADGGRCEKAEADLRQAVVSSPNDPGTRQAWVELMIFLGRPRETLTAALEPKWPLVPESERPIRKALDLAGVDIACKEDVSAANARLREAEELLAKNPNAALYEELASFKMFLLSSTGEAKEAGRVAEDYVKRARGATGSDALVGTNWHYARFKGGIIERGEYEALGQEMMAKWRENGRSPWSVWGEGHEFALDDVDEARRALRDLPAGSVPPPRAGQVGATYATLGRYAEALPLLRVSSCSDQTPGIQYHTARSLEETGDGVGACKLYLALQARGGDSPMIQAKHVRERIAALQCSAAATDAAVSSSGAP